MARTSSREAIMGGSWRFVVRGHSVSARHPLGAIGRLFVPVCLIGVSLVPAQPAVLTILLTLILLFPILLPAPILLLLALLPLSPTPLILIRFSLPALSRLARGLLPLALLFLALHAPILSALAELLPIPLLLAELILHARRPVSLAILPLVPKTIVTLLLAELTLIPGLGLLPLLTGALGIPITVAIEGVFLPLAVPLLVASFLVGHGVPRYVENETEKLFTAVGRCRKGCA